MSSISSFPKSIGKQSFIFNDKQKDGTDRQHLDLQVCFADKYKPETVIIHELL